MHQIGTTNYALGALIFAAVLTSASASQAGESEKGASEAAALPIQDNFAKMMAHMEATNTQAINPEGLMRQVVLLHARCDPCNSAMPREKPMHEDVLAKPTQDASAVNNDNRDKEQ
jgi:hypothetical protein